jgi:hypothetical protein
VTENWLVTNGFPQRSVLQPDVDVDDGGGDGQGGSFAPSDSVSRLVLSSGADVFVTDKFDDFVAVNNSLVSSTADNDKVASKTCAYLLDSERNRHYDVGHRRISSVYDIPFC